DQAYWADCRPLSRDCDAQPASSKVAAAITTARAKWRCMAAMLDARAPDRDVTGGKGRGQATLGQWRLGDDLDPGAAAVAQGGHERGPVRAGGQPGTCLQVVEQRPQETQVAVGHV